MQNHAWNFENEQAMLSALAGSEVGSTLLESLPELINRKTASASFISRILSVTEEDTLCEIGSGVGIVADIMAKSTKKLVSSDISQTFQEVAKANSSSANIEFELLTPGDLSKLGKHDINKFFSEGCFIHLNCYEIFNYATQIYEILPRGGLLTFDIAPSDNINIFSQRVWIEHLEAFKANRESIIQLQSYHSIAFIQNMLGNIGFFIDVVYTPTWHYAWIVARKP